MSSNRRGFLKSATAALAAAPLYVPSSAFGANDRLVYGLIGTGGRGRSLNRTFQKIGAQCAALCDVYEPHVELARQESPKGIPSFVDHRELLAAPGLDFVVIATTDHHHCPQLLDALNARKDVYLEKPLSLNLEESRRMIAAVAGTDRVVEIGMQRRSMPFIRRAKSFIDDGKLGQVTMAKASWNWNFALPLDNSPLPGKLDWERFLGSAPKRALEPRRFRWWRAFYDYSGGNMTDQGTHLMDVVQWMMGSGPPASAVAHGQVLGAAGAEVPNVFSAIFEYPGYVATWTLNYRSSQDYDWSILFQGDKASMILDRHGCRIYSDGGSSPTPWSQRPNSELIYREDDRDGPELHMRDMLECVRTRKRPNCTVEIAAAAVAGPHMANLALREDRKVKRPEGAA